MKFIPAGRATFILQTSIVITPVLSLLAGVRITVSVCLGCTLALAGVMLIYTSSIPTDTVATVEGDTDAEIVHKGDLMSLAVRSNMLSFIVIFFVTFTDLFYF